MSQAALRSLAPASKMAAPARRSRPFRVSIEGNIGCGKSTCIKYFEKFANVEVHPEPLAEWRDVAGHNLLALLYSDLPRWSFSFQHYVHLSRLKIQTSPPASPHITVKMFERSVQNSRHCFVELAARARYLQGAELGVLRRWFDYTERHLDITLDLIVYLRSTPEVAWERVVRRGRSEEAEVPLDYLRQVHEAYERWLGGSAGGTGPGCELLTVDADQPLEAVLRDLDAATYKILGHNHTS